MNSPFHLTEHRLFRRRDSTIPRAVLRQPGPDSSLVSRVLLHQGNDRCCKVLLPVCSGLANVLCVLQWLNDRQSGEIGRNTFIKGSEFGQVDLTPLLWQGLQNGGPSCLPQGSRLLLQPHNSSLLFSGQFPSLLS